MIYGVRDGMTGRGDLTPPTLEDSLELQEWGRRQFFRVLNRPVSRDLAKGAA